MFVRDFAEELVVAILGVDDAVVCQDRLREDGRDVVAVFLERFADGVLVVERHWNRVLGE